MKIYGNAKSDGFPLLMTAIAAVFVAGGVGLSTVGGLAMLLAIPAFGVIAALMVTQLRKWDVMSEVRHPLASEASSAPETIAVGEPSFPVIADSDLVSGAAPAAWAAGRITDSLPAPVGKPTAPVKTVVETNTVVA